MIAFSDPEVLEYIASHAGEVRDYLEKFVAEYNALLDADQVNRDYDAATDLIFGQTDKPTGGNASPASDR